MEINELRYSSLKSLDVMEMEALLKQSPWFSYLREILLERLYRLDREAFDEQLIKTAVFLSSRKTLYERINAPQAEDEVVQEEPVAAVSTPLVQEAAMEVEVVHKPRVVVVGGDFFSKEDLKSISPEDDMELKLRNSPFYRSAEEPVAEEQPKEKSGRQRRSSLMTEDGKVNFDDLAFCTETLGHIYAQQGFTDKAIEVFSKLILLYPQKSAYFAALIQDLKNNLN